MLAVVLLLSCKKDDYNKFNGAVTDIDGNVYHTVKIGTQVWMVENLRTTRFNDGTAIDVGTIDNPGQRWHTPQYCWYENNIVNKDKYGALYNFWAVHPTYLIDYYLAPAGWHVPSKAEWETLINYLGGGNIAGGKMKSKGTIEAGSGLWYSPNTGATNESGFSALPGGICFSNGPFNYAGVQGYYWTDQLDEVNGAWCCSINNYSTNITVSGLGPSQFISIRCIKN